MPHVGFQHREESREKIAEATVKQWKDPETRNRMSEALRAAWARRRAAVAVCPCCGRPFEPESGRE